LHAAQSKLPANAAAAAPKGTAPAAATRPIPGVATVVHVTETFGYPPNAATDIALAAPALF